MPKQLKIAMFRRERPNSMFFTLSETITILKLFLIWFRKCGFSIDAVNISLTGITIFKASAQTSAPVAHSYLHNLRRLCHNNSGACLLLEHWLGHHWLRIPWLRIPLLRIFWLSHRVSWLHAIGSRRCRSMFHLHCVIFRSLLFRHASKLLSYIFKRKIEGIYRKCHSCNRSKQL